MPRLSPGTRADVLLGVAGGPVSINQVPLPIPAGLACWLDDDHIVMQVFSAQAHVVVVNVRSGLVVYENPWRAVNQLAAGGGRWLAADGAGVFGSLAFSGYALGLTENDGRGAAGDDGTLAMVQHGGRGFELHSPSGGVVTVADVLARGLCVLGPGRAIWHDDAGRLHAIGVDVPVQLPTATNLRVVDVAGAVPWLISFCSAIGLVAHPWDSLMGVKITGVGEAAFYPDARLIANKLRVVYATGPGELPGDLVTVDDAFALPRVDLRTLLAPAPITIPFIDKHILCGFFAGGPTAPHPWTTSDDPHALPGNCYLRVADNLICRMSDDQPIAQYVAAELEGQSIVLEVLKARARHPALPVIPYWRRQDHGGPIPPGDYIGIEHYRLAGEPIEAYEVRGRALVRRVAPAAPAILIAPCYTSNSNNTTDLASVVPVAARLARDLAAVWGVLVFSGTGRATGLQDHPDVRPLWQALADGIPGLPILPPLIPIPQPDPIDPPEDEDNMPIVSEEKFVEYIDAAGEIIVDFFQKIGKPIMAEDGVHGHLEPIVLARQNARSAGDRYRGAGVNATLTDMVMGSIMERITERTGVPLDARTVLDPLVARIVAAQERLRRA